MNFDSYHVIAEISVALTGFIGIILVLQHRDMALYLFAMILFDSPEDSEGQG